MGYCSADRKLIQGAGTFWNKKNQVIISRFIDNIPTGVTATFYRNCTMKIHTYKDGKPLKLIYNGSRFDEIVHDHPMPDDYNGIEGSARTEIRITGFLFNGKPA